jgi:hypothetical protein
VTTKWLVGLLLILAVGAASAMAADVDGAWTASAAGPNGQTFEMKFNFKADGEKLTGTMSGPMGAGAAEIQDGTVQGDSISFKVKREFQGNAMVLIYKGKVAGDEIKFTSQREGSDRPPREMTAKRAK